MKGPASSAPLFDDMKVKKPSVRSERDYSHIKGVFNEGLCFLLDLSESNPHRAEILGIALSRNQEEAIYVPINHPEADNISDALSILKYTFEDHSIVKISHDIKSQMIALHRKAIDLKGPLIDTMIASYLLDPNSTNHHLERLSEDYLNVGITSTDNAKKPRIQRLSLEDSAQLLGQRLLCIRRLQEVLFKLLKDNNLNGIYEYIEMPLIKILARMELQGIKIDTQRLSGFSKEMASLLEQIEVRIYGIAGERFNINSPQQLSRILFDKFKLKPTRKTKTGYSTDTEVLHQLALSHDLPAEILNYRTLSKLKGTYIDALPPLINHYTGRIHSTFHQAVTATGRLSSSDPNMQNIPIKGEWGIKIREAFVAEEGFMLISSDYSQIELRLLAHLSGDERLLKAFIEGKDIHTSTAALLFRVSDDRVDREMRRVAKVVNFGILYGMSPYGLSEALKIGMTEASEYIDNYFRLYSGVKSYIDKAIQSARETGFAYTLFGRRRAIGDINSPNTNLRQQAERIAVNTPIQGTAADLIKVAMIRVDRAISGQGLISKMILQIHDELLFESPHHEVDTMKDLVKREMESATALSVPLKVDIRHGPNWGAAH